MSNEEVTGRVSLVVWQSDDGDAVIARVVTADNKTVVVRGPNADPPVQESLTYRFVGGKWVDHPRHGKQFEYGAYSLRCPEDRRGIIAYLSALCEGIGERRAGRIYDAYGPLAVQSLRTDPDAVASACSIDLATCRDAANDLRRESAYEGVKVALLSLLAGRGFRLGLVVKACIRRWRERAADVVRRNPYALLLAGVPSCGWRRCDKLYRDLGHDPARLKRQALCAVYAAQEHRGGDTWIPAEVVGKKIVDAIGGGKADPVRAIRLAVRAKMLCVCKLPRQGVTLVALAAHARAESHAARQVKELSRWVNLKLTAMLLRSKRSSRTNATMPT